MPGVPGVLKMLVAHLQRTCLLTMRVLIHRASSLCRHHRFRQARLPQRPRWLATVGQALLRHRLLHAQPGRIAEIMPIGPAIDLRAP